MDNYAYTLTAEFARMARRLGVRNNLQDAIAQCGEAMRIDPLTVAEARLVVDVVRACGGFDTFRPRQCFYNSQRVVAWDWHDDDASPFEYCEGYVASARLPLGIQHGWLRLRASGKVVDLTMRANRKHDRNDYFGVAVPAKIVRANCLDTEHWSPIFEGRVGGAWLRAKLDEAAR